MTATIMISFLTITPSKRLDHEIYVDLRENSKKDVHNTSSMLRIENGIGISLSVDLNTGSVGWDHLNLPHDSSTPYLINRLDPNLRRLLLFISNISGLRSELLISNHISVLNTWLLDLYGLRLYIQLLIARRFFDLMSWVFMWNLIYDRHWFSERRMRSIILNIYILH